MSGRRDGRSRSPVKVDSVGRRRDHLKQNYDANNTPKSADMSNVMNPMMMTNMYPPQGNMMMGGMYNMMMSNPMISGGMMPSGGMEIMSGTGMEIMPQQPMDMAGMPGPTIGGTGSGMEMNLMGGVIIDPNMMGVYPNMSEVVEEKKEIVLRYCRLLPPTPGTPEPLRRERPPGCRTIFVGGLPDKIREVIVREIFQRYGGIQILRLSKQNFCHIRFYHESCVDAAMGITGYQIKLTTKDKDAKENENGEDSRATSGWLHVDYAMSRDDLNEYNRRQHKAIRAQKKHMQQLTAQQEAIASSLGASYRRTPSPVRIQPYSNAAVIQLAEKIKNEEHFSNTLPTLIAWLERGECSKKNSNQFYSMIQTTNSHIRRLFNEKVQAEDELLECKERVKCHIQDIIEQLEQVAKVFIAATQQRIWDHFTKPQRKNIETWQKITQEFNSMKEEFNEKFLNDDGEVFNSNNRSNNSMDCINEDTQELRQENESLRFQLEAYKNEVDVIKADAQKEMEKFKAQFIARQALQGAFDKNPPLPSPIAKPPPPPPSPSPSPPSPSPPSENNVKDNKDLTQSVEAGCGEAKLIGVMSAFLQVHPQGASLDYVVSYVRALFPSTTQAAVHRVLLKHEDVFQQTTSGVGANIENRWTFIALARNQ